MNKQNGQVDTLQLFKELMRVYSAGTSEQADAEAEAIYQTYLARDAAPATEWKPTTQALVSTASGGFVEVCYAPSTAQQRQTKLVLVFHRDQVTFSQVLNEWEVEPLIKNLILAHSAMKQHTGAAA